MDCLINYIGLKECGDNVEPVSGIFINSLAGINRELIQKIADSEQRTYARVWDDVQKIAARRFYSSSIGKLRENYKLQNVREEIFWQPTTDGSLEAAGAPVIKGVKMDFAFTYFTFQAFTIAQILLVASASGTIAVKIQDRFGNELYTKNAVVTAGLNLITVDKTFAEEELFVGADFTSIQSKSSELTNNDIFCYCQAIKRCCNDCSPTIEGYTFAGGLYTKTSNNTHGIGVRGYIRCDYNSIVCYNKELFSSSWMFLLGNQLMIEVLGSPRMVQATTVDRDRIRELKDFYQVMFEKELEQAVKGIHLDTQYDCCISCNDNPEYKAWLP